MADETSTPTRDAKLIQYLNEAYGKEKELETALQAHIKLAKRPPYKKRLQEHLKETKDQAKALERRIKALGGKAERGTPLPLPVGPAAAVEATAAVTAAASKAIAAAQGPLHALRGSSDAEKQLKNAKDELKNEYEEIGNYTAIETFADAVGDPETAKLARDFRKQEERMAAFLTKLIPQLAKAVVTEEIPAAERRALRAGSARTSGSSSRASAGSRSTRSAASRSTGSTRSAASRSSGPSRSSRSSGASSRAAKPAGGGSRARRSAS